MKIQRKKERERTKERERKKLRKKEKETKKERKGKKLRKKERVVHDEIRLPHALPDKTREIPLAFSLSRAPKDPFSLKATALSVPNGKIMPALSLISPLLQA